MSLDNEESLPMKCDSNNNACLWENLQASIAIDTVIHVFTRQPQDFDLEAANINVGGAP